MYFTAAGQPYAYRGSERSSLQLLDADSATGRVFSSLVTQFADQRVGLASESMTADKLVFFVSSDRNSGEYYLYDQSKREAALLAARHAWLDPARMAEVKSVSYVARDGLQIDAYITLPPGLPPSKLPTVVMPHGGPIGVSDGWFWDAEAQFLASRGYAVVQMNYRGSGGKGEAFERMGYGEWGGKIINDITDAARWAVAQGYADPQRMCISGGSYGGYAALMSAVREPDLYRCAVGYSGVYDLNLLFAESDVTHRQSGRLFWQESMGKTPEERARQSPIAYIDRLKAAVMIVHGGRDIRAPVSQAKVLRKALEARGKRFEWLVKDEEGHGFGTAGDRIEYYEKLAAFLDKNIGR